MRYLVYALFLIVLSAMSASSNCTEADRLALIKFDKDWTDANAKGDRNLIASFYADEFTVFPTLTGKQNAIDAAIRTAEQNRLNPQAATRTTADHYMFSCTPTTATMTHRNVIFQPTANNGKGATTYGRSVHFLEKRNGKWVAVANAGGPLSESDILRYMELDWIDAVKKRNFDWFENNYASDFTEVSFVTGEINNKQNTINAMKADKTVFDSMDVSEVNIRIDGNAAIVTGLGHARGKDGDGKPFDIKLRFTDTFVKRDGRWQAWASQATPVAASRTP